MNVVTIIASIEPAIIQYIVKKTGVGSIHALSLYEVSLETQQ